MIKADMGIRTSPVNVHTERDLPQNLGEQWRCVDELVVMQEPGVRRFLGTLRLGRRRLHLDAQTLQPHFSRRLSTSELQSTCKDWSSMP